MKSKTTYVYYAIKTKILIEAYGYFGVSQQKSTPIRVLLFYPGGGTFTLLQWEYFWLND